MIGGCNNIVKFLIYSMRAHKHASSHLFLILAQTIWRSTGEGVLLTGFCVIFRFFVYILWAIKWMSRWVHEKLWYWICLLWFYFTVSFKWMSADIIPCCVHFYHEYDLSYHAVSLLFLLSRMLAYGLFSTALLPETLTALYQRPRQSSPPWGFFTTIVSTPTLRYHQCCLSLSCFLLLFEPVCALSHTQNLSWPLWFYSKKYL